MNKRDAINHIRQFGGRLDRFRKSVGGSGDGGRNAPKRAKSSPKPVNRKPTFSTNRCAMPSTAHCRI